ncbi:ArsR/SmtB family transcription factor [Streptomonospora alba]|uniref:ArsR/SmtB family transcription factor n=1 Tax=Streptomonospora alba TaxID=183763 RepID=UPI000699ABA7|nr:winged helix-turn-helix domain-containing protein [Streptomonospora alba]
MLRIRFDEQYPEAVHLAERPDALWEMLLSLHALQDPRAAPGHEPWRQRVCGRLTAPMRRLAEFAPPTGYSPDFLTPPTDADGLDEGLAAVRATPVHRLRRDLRLLSRQQPRSAVVRNLLREGATGLGPLTETMRAYFDLAVAPVWEDLNTAVEQSLGRTAPRTAAPLLPSAQPVPAPGRSAPAPGAGAPPTARPSSVGLGPAPRAPAAPPASHGLRDLPAPLRRSARWHGPVLEVAYPVPRDLVLAGRDLHLVPSYFCHRYPIAFYDPQLPPVLVYPAVHTAVPVAAAVDPRRRAALEKLLGRTRAAVLAAIADGCTTTELSRCLDISPASASEHATVLRSAGLIRSHRERNTVRHRVTELGLRLLADADGG